MPVFSRGVALGLWLLCISQGLGAAPESLSYADALRLALHSAPQNEAAAAGLEAAQVVRQAAGELPDPQLILGLDNLPLDGRERFSLNQDPMTQRRLGVMQSVPNAAKRAAREQQAEAEIGLALAASQLSQRQSRLQAALAWLELYYLEQRQPLLAQWRQAVAMQRDSLPAALAEGRSTPAEWLQLDQQWLLLDERDEELQRDLQAARSQLARWIGAAAWQSLQGPPPQRTLDAAQLQAALQQHPDLQVQRARVVQADAGLQQALAEKRPDWAVEVAYGNRAGYGDMLMLEWRVDLPLFVGTRQGPRIAAQRQLQRQSEAQQHALWRQLQAELQGALASRQQLQQAVQRSQTQLVPLAEQTVTLQLAAYQAGGQPLQAVLLARQALADSRLRELQLQGRLSQLDAQLYHLYLEEPQP